MAVKDKFIEIISKNDDPLDTLQVWKNIFEVDDSLQIFLLSTCLHNIRMAEGNLIEKYLQIAWDL